MRGLLTAANRVSSLLAVEEVGHTPASQGSGGSPEVTRVTVRWCRHRQHRWSGGGARAGHAGHVDTTLQVKRWMWVLLELGSEGGGCGCVGDTLRVHWALHPRGGS
eukprot:1185846-Prorocentrum_minimum.AAC.4